MCMECSNSYSIVKNSKHTETMIQFTIFSALLISYCSLVQSQKLGGCPAEPPTVPDFNATAVSENIFVFKYVLWILRIK